MEKVGIVSSPMDLERDGNFIEAGVWFVLAVMLFVYAFRGEKRLRPTLFLIVATLAVFGGSDLVEARTGAWWKPWWLFAWKAACVIILFFGFLNYYRMTKKRSAKNGNTTKSSTHT
jgi:hypothetical protein